MDLHFQKLGEEGKSLIILHGLFGSSDNWLSIGRVLSAQYQVYLLDQRNHGKSPHSDDWDYTVMSDDLLHFVESQGLEKPFVLGHSMGGKTAMHFACRFPEQLSRLIVADMSVKGYPPHHQRILQALQSMPLDSLGSRKDAENHMRQYLSQTDTIAFLLKNLYRDEDGRYAWRINVPVIARQIDEIAEALPEDFRAEALPTLFLRGAKSDYVADADWPMIEATFPLATLRTIENAGHWLHAEQPEAFIKEVQDFLT